MSQSTRQGDHTYSLTPDQSTSMTVVETVANAEGVEPTELRPLYSAIDPDALDSLFEGSADEEPSFLGQVQFQYHGYEVCIDESGRVTLFDA